MSNAANCRNFVVAGHSGGGKTTLCEQILRLTGAIQRAGTVEGKNTVSDFMIEEQTKQSSIYASLMNCSWRDTKLFFTDTPGYGEFVGQVVGAIRASDAALVVIDAIDGPQIGTARAWKIAKQRKIPRFGLVNRLDYYSADELCQILHRSAGLLDIDLAPEGALGIARRSRGTPRVANALLRWVRDYAQVRADGRITAEVAQAALGMIDIDDDGLDEMDKRLLETIIYKFGGGPVGLSSLAVAVGEDESTIEDVHEPFLIMQGYIKRTPRGREALPAAYHKLGAVLPGGQTELGL